MNLFPLSLATSTPPLDSGEVALLEGISFYVLLLLLPLVLLLPVVAFVGLIAKKPLVVKIGGFGFLIALVLTLLLAFTPFIFGLFYN